MVKLWIKVWVKLNFKLFKLQTLTFFKVRRSTTKYTEVYFCVPLCTSVNLRTCSVQASVICCFGWLLGRLGFMVLTFFAEFSSLSRICTASAQGVHTMITCLYKQDYYLIQLDFYHKQYSNWHHIFMDAPHPLLPSQYINHTMRIFIFAKIKCMQKSRVQKFRNQFTQ